MIANSKKKTDSNREYSNKKINYSNKKFKYLNKNYAIISINTVHYIFASANTNQNRELQKIIINLRWTPSILNDQVLQAQIDSFNFNSYKITHAL